LIVRKIRPWLPGIFSGLIALAALVAGSAFGNIRSHHIDDRLIAWISAGVLVIFGTYASTRLSSRLGQLASHRTVPSAGGAVRIVTAIVGYLIVIFGVLAVLEVSIERLLVGAGLAGIVLGIAATQSLGNVFAGMVLILSRPFDVGDHIRIRSGALGGVFDAWVMELTLTYTTLRLDDGKWKIPNSAMLAAGVGQLPRTTAAPPVPQLPGFAPSGTVPPSSASPAGPPDGLVTEPPFQNPASGEPGSASGPSRRRWIPRS
jgi:small-conductance mechanosensitive channel